MIKYATVSQMIVLLCFVGPCYSIKCYECVHNNQRVKRHNRYVYPCVEFDASSRYVMDCPDSQFCIYKHIKLQLVSSNIVVSTMDGCTPSQTGPVTENILIREGCVDHRNDYKPSSSEYCYCGFDLCNSAQGRHLSPYLTVFMTVTLTCMWKLLT